jgi:hypothetical protein
MKSTIDMAREAGYMKTVFGGAEISMASIDCLKDFEALVRADEREEFQRWFDAVTTQHKQEILAEREACAKVCEDDAWRCKKIAVETQNKKANAAALEAYLCAEAIRARSNT